MGDGPEPAACLAAAVVRRLAGWLLDAEHEFPEHRRCTWCARRLRWWQLAWCRRCASHVGTHRRNGGPSYPYGSQRDALPDNWLGSP